MADPSFQHRDPAGPEFWSERFEQKFTPWDKGGVPATLRDFAARFPQPRVALIPGCGTGHEVAYLSEAGWDVTAIDFSLLQLLRREPISGLGPGASSRPIFSPSCRQGRWMSSTNALSCAPCRAGCGLRWSGAGRNCCARVACSPDSFTSTTTPRGRHSVSNPPNWTPCSHLFLRVSKTSR